MNETRSPKPAPPRWIEAIVKWFMPRSATARLEDLKDYPLPAPQLVWKAAGTVSASNLTWTRRAFNFERVLAETFVLSVPFWWTPLLPAVIAVTSAVAVLRLRDAFIYPGEGTPAEATADSLVGASAIVASQLLLWFVAPSLMMEPALLARGTVIGMLSVSLLRAYFHLKTPEYDPDRQRAAGWFKSTWRIMAMWLVACITLIFSSIEAVPGGLVRNFLLGFCPVMSFFLALKLQSDTLQGLFRRHEPITIFTDPVEVELSAKKNALWQRSDIVLSQCFEVVFFVVLAFPLVSAVWRWLDGSAADVDWPQVATNFAALVTLAYLWTQIKKLNAEALRQIDEALAERREEALST